MISSKGISTNFSWLEPRTGPSIRVLPPPSWNQVSWPGDLILRQESIKALLRTLSARDSYTGYHSFRVTNLVLTFARSLGLSSLELQTLSNAGFLHDIGKIGISDTILLKPGPLTPSERAIIQTHPLIGVKIVEPLGLTSQEKDLILLHHERWDGQGYPRGLQGSNIPFLWTFSMPSPRIAPIAKPLRCPRPWLKSISRRAISLTRTSPVSLLTW